MTALAEVLEKLERATPGEWPAPEPSRFMTTHFSVGDQPPYTLVSRNECDLRAAVAAVNWLREHGPALLRDAGDGWLPIESAPRDGTAVIVWFKQHGALSCRWTDRDDDSSSEWAHWHVDDFKHGPFPVRGYNDGDDTHWRPLPKPPAMHAPGGD